MRKTLPDPSIKALQAAQRGKRAEDLACDWLSRQGLVLVERNSRFRGGEIDLVMRAGSVLVFVEVRYRSSQAFGGAIESLGRQKQARIRHAAACFLKRSFGDSHWPACRFDVVLVQGSRLSWIEAAF
ncbi:MAG: YraN family protein [Betaproteobacteria bacterium]|nr:YraN family protein [Pseudomonadota bacterium]NBO11293.1 YraN family protein [Betaproteobacteria bacterium]NBO44248.1 YraN family protein [Betaproteobacteria bacterium]NBP09542.1 YraN family protein [Betaproteobacteria bacterium]NBP60869.1 YraN family protein [Betaproteobacteria bacterium]